MCTTASEAKPPRTVPINASATSTAFILTAPLPGVNPEDVTITRTERTIQLSAMRHNSELPQYLVQEWDCEQYAREVDVPDSYGSEVQATLTNGVLEIHVLAGEFTGTSAEPLHELQARWIERRDAAGRRRSDLSANQQAKLASSLVAFNHLTPDPQDSEDTLAVLIDACTSILPNCGFSVSLLLTDGTLQCVVASEEPVRLLTEQQLNDSSGPGIDAFNSREDLFGVILEEASDRWPRFVPLAAAVGFQTIHAIPLQTGEAVVGLLCIYDRKQRHVGELRVDLLLALAAGAASGIANTRSHLRVNERADQLQHALNSRVLIEQAKGVLAARLGLDPDEAFALLRRYSRNNGMRIHDAAELAIAGKLSGMDLRLVKRPQGVTTS